MRLNLPYLWIKIGKNMLGVCVDDGYPRMFSERYGYTKVWRFLGLKVQWKPWHKGAFRFRIWFAPKNPNPAGLLSAEASGSQATEASEAGRAGTLQEAQARIQRDLATKGCARVADVHRVLGDPVVGVGSHTLEAESTVALGTVCGTSIPRYTSRCEACGCVTGHREDCPQWRRHD